MAGVDEAGVMLLKSEEIAKCESGEAQYPKM